jgi:hypothetical protein
MGWIVKTGATAAELTVKVAPALETEPALLEATTVKVPASADVALAIV